MKMHDAVAHLRELLFTKSGAVLTDLQVDVDTPASAGGHPD